MKAPRAVRQPWLRAKRIWRRRTGVALESQYGAGASAIMWLFAELVAG
jgi:hypothetical protein